jgi:glutamine amidotransferase
VGYEPLISNRVEDLERADKLILPGVGAFGDGMANLYRLGLVEPLTRLVTQHKPILGICLGAQLIARESYEFGHHRGLGWIEASVVKIDTNGQALRLPHVGWNDLYQVKDSLLFEDIPPEALFYYVHSFRIKCDSSDIVIGECEYGTRFTAAFQKGNIYGTQFHPEKSQLHGLNLLKNFLEKA